MLAMQDYRKNQWFLTGFLVVILAIVAIAWLSLGTREKQVFISLGLVILLVALVGGILIAVGYARKGWSAKAGALTGVFVGGSVSLVTIGLFSIAEGNAVGNVTYTLLGIASVGAGAMLLWALRMFPPSQQAAVASRTSQVIKIPSFLRSQRQTSPNRTPVTPTPEHSHRTGCVFISYRREDSPDVTGRIYDRLVQIYGKDSVFKDIDSIPFGTDFRKYLSSAIGQCEAVLVVIGEHWLTVTNADGKPRLEDEGDFVRMEIEAALERSIPVIPLLVQGASMPGESVLPPSLKALAYRNGVYVRHDPDFHNDMDRLIKSLGRILDHGSTANVRRDQ
jgi:hypothetical protein